MGVRQGGKLGGGGGGRKFTRFFPIVPNLLKKCPVVNFPKILSARVEGYRQKNYHGLLQFLVSFSLFLYFQMLCFICPFPRADGAKRRARVLIPPGYLHPGKRKH